jgi:MFS family permease
MGSLFACAAFAILAVAHAHPWQMYLGSALLGAGIGLAFASLANLIVEAVRPEQTGVATGMNTVMRTIGGSVGGQVVASILAGTVVAGTLPSEHGFTVAFSVAALACALAALASLAVPPRERRTEPAAAAATGAA